jgi:hypothetical protein
MMPRLAGLLSRVTGEGLPALPLSSSQIFLAMCVVPLCTRLMRAIPPLSLLQEERP